MYMLENIFSVAFSSSGEFVASASLDMIICLIDLKTFQLIQFFENIPNCNLINIHICINFFICCG